MDFCKFFVTSLLRVTDLVFFVIRQFDHSDFGFQISEFVRAATSLPTGTSPYS